MRRGKGKALLGKENKSRPERRYFAQHAAMRKVELFGGVTRALHRCCKNPCALRVIGTTGRSYGFDILALGL